LFAVLGDILFEVIGSPETFDSVREYDFAEHRVIESKPRLQWVGNGLERLKLETMLHASFTDPGAQMSLLRATAAAHRALPLVFGNGGFRGFYVIESLAMRSKQLSASGTPIAITAALSLKEWATLTELDLLTLSGLPTLGLASKGSTASSTKSDRALPGVSPLLSLRSASGATGPQLQTTDVLASSIVRSAAR